jgi:hypothetical protein
MSIQNDPNTLVDPKFIGIPYDLGKRTLEGCDCIGLMIMFMAEHGVQYEYDDKQGPILEHWWESNPRRFLNAISQHGALIQFSDIKKFDILLFFGEESFNRFPTCLGVMIDDRHFLIALEKRGSCVLMLDKIWRGKFWGAIRMHKAVEAGLV